MSSTTTTEAEEFARLALGSRALKNRRVRRALIARLLNENGETQNGDDTETAGEEGGDEQEFVRALVGSRMLKRRRVRRALLAHLLRGKGEYEADGTEGEGEDNEEFGDTDGNEQEIVRGLIASRVLRRRRVRRALLAHLLRADGATDGEADADTFDGDEGTDDDRDVARALIASRVLRHRRARRAILAHLLNEQQTNA